MKIRIYDSIRADSAYHSKFFSTRQKYFMHAYIFAEWLEYLPQRFYAHDDCEFTAAGGILYDVLYNPL